MKHRSASPLSQRTGAIHKKSYSLTSPEGTSFHYVISANATKYTVYLVLHIVLGSEDFSVILDMSSLLSRLVKIKDLTLGDSWVKGLITFHITQRINFFSYPLYFQYA